MENANEAIGLLIDKYCEKCSSFFECEYEVGKHGCFCNCHEALNDGFLINIDRLRNGTTPSNTCKYFSDRDSQPAPVVFVLPG